MVKVEPSRHASVVVGSVSRRVPLLPLPAGLAPPLSRFRQQTTSHLANLAHRPAGLYFHTQSAQNFPLLPTTISCCTHFFHYLKRPYDLRQIIFIIPFLLNFFLTNTSSPPRESSVTRRCGALVLSPSFVFLKFANGPHRIVHQLV